MKCPHCNVGIAEVFGKGQLASYPQFTTLSGESVPSVVWFWLTQRCPECHDAIVNLEKHLQGQGGQKFMAYPNPPTAVCEIPLEVTDPFRQDFKEACLVLPLSAKASAALSRRLLQSILREKGQVKKKDLADQIDEVTDAKAGPGHIAEDLHAVRNIGHFAAHPTKSKNTGEIMDVEPGEAEWNLDVVEPLFDFYFVQPELSKKRKAALNVKLTEAGKPNT